VSILHVFGSWRTCAADADVDERADLNVFAVVDQLKRKRGHADGRVAFEWHQPVVGGALQTPADLVEHLGANVGDVQGDAGYAVVSPLRVLAQVVKHVDFVGLFDLCEAAGRVQDEVDFVDAVLDEGSVAFDLLLRQFPVHGHPVCPLSCDYW